MFPSARPPSTTPPTAREAARSPLRCADEPIGATGAVRSRPAGRRHLNFAPKSGHAASHGCRHAPAGQLVSRRFRDRLGLGRSGVEAARQTGARTGTGKRGQGAWHCGQSRALPVHVQALVRCRRLPARWRPARRLRLHQRRRQGAQSRSAGQDVRRRRWAAQQRLLLGRRQEVRGPRSRPSLLARGAPRHRHGGLRLLQGRQVPGGHRLGASATRRCIPAPRTRRWPTTSSPRPTSTRSRIPTRDQTATRKALAELKTLRAALSRQPLQPSRPRTASASPRTLLAASEMNVGRYYQKRNNHVARHQSLQDRGHRVPDHAAGRGGALPPGRDQHGARHRARGPGGRRRARAQLSELASGTSTPTRC